MVHQWLTVDRVLPRNESYVAFQLTPAHRDQSTRYGIYYGGSNFFIDEKDGERYHYPDVAQWKYSKMKIKKNPRVAFDPDDPDSGWDIYTIDERGEKFGFGAEATKREAMKTVAMLKKKLEQFPGQKWHVVKAGPEKNPRVPVSMKSSGIKIVYNRLLGGWYVVRGPHNTPIGGRYDSQEAAAQSLIDAAHRRDSASIRKNPRVPVSMKLWKWDKTIGYWMLEKVITEPGTAQQWLAIHQLDEPTTPYKLSRSKPRAKPTKNAHNMVKINPRKKAKRSYFIELCGARSGICYSTSDPKKMTIAALKDKARAFSKKYGEPITAKRITK